MIMGKVARILSDEEVVLNVGSVDGVKEDMELVIYSEGDHIFDPETGDDLGAKEIVKGRVKVYHVQDRMARARTLMYQVRRPSPIEQVVRYGALGSSVETRRRKLQVSKEQALPLAEDLAVKVGDKVHSF